MPGDSFSPTITGRDNLLHLMHHDSGGMGHEPFYWGSLCMTSNVPKSQHRRDELVWTGLTCFECMRVKQAGIDARARYDAEVARKRAQQ